MNINERQDERKGLQHDIPEVGKVPQDARQEHNVLVHQQSSYTGPIPPPAMLEEYKKVYTQAPEIILHEFEANSKHIREREMEALRGINEGNGWPLLFVLQC